MRYRYSTRRYREGIASEVRPLPSTPRIHLELGWARSKFAGVTTDDGSEVVVITSTPTVPLASLGFTRSVDGYALVDDRYEESELR